MFQNMEKLRNSDLTDMIAKTITTTAVICFLFVALFTLEDLTNFVQVLKAQRWSYMMLLLGQALLTINIGALIWRIILVWSYKPARECTDDELPMCTVIVPAYNEGHQVYDTIVSLVKSDYPHDKLEIIAVNDGSKDDSWYWMHKAAQEFPDIVDPINCVMNRGKRQALNEGFLKARGSVIVTVDSDSEVEVQTLRRMVSPMVLDRKVGGVAGNVRVLNRRDGILPRMLDVSFTYSFDFIRASQSYVNSVLCTPGALSAYRADIVNSVREEWLKQTFCGRPANIGEDRAMTNLILRNGYHVHFQQDAIVYTKVPTDYKTLCKMFLRWARSNVRETLVISGFAFKKFRPTPATGTRVNLLLQIIQMTLPILLQIQTVFCLIAAPFIFGTHLIFGAMIASLIPIAVYTWRHRNGNGLWAIPYSVFWVFGLSWIAPYALFTAHKGGWLTRELPANAEQKQPAIINAIHPSLTEVNL
ncbi:MAG TPA: glycosyltransferase [Phycisphaerae bacterium]|nr:glycosyltransferase [Phycisphaerae bacterium]